MVFLARGLFDYLSCHLVFLFFCWIPGHIQDKIQDKTKYDSRTYHIPSANGAAVVIGGSGHVLGCTPGGAEGVLLEGPRGAPRASGGREAMGKTKVCFPTKVLTRSDAVLRLARHFVRRISISHACRYRQDHPRPNARTKLPGQNES